MTRSEFDPSRYYLPTEQRHALWQNEFSMLIVLAMPVVVAAFWYGSTVQVVDQLGRVISPALLSRGIGLALLAIFVAGFGGALWLYVQPAVERVDHAQPIRGHRRLAYAAFDGLLVGLITYQSLPDARVTDGAVTLLISVVAGVGVGLIAFVALHSMVDIPPDQERARRSYPPGETFTN